MKKSLLATALVLFASVHSIFAAEAKVLIVTDANTYRGYLVGANKSSLLWRETQKSTVTRKQRRSGATVYFFQPKELTEALELYKSRNYQDAAVKFAQVAQDYQKVRDVPGNPGTLAGFYELECARQMYDLEKLADLFAKYDPDSLLRKYHKIQFEMYGVFWDAVRSQSWSRLDAIVRDQKWRDRKLPGSLRAQIAFCHGLALEGGNQPMKALEAYNTAFVADFAASEEISRRAAENCLRILLNQEDVKTTMELYGTEDYSDNSRGAALIREATALIKLWEQVLGAGTPLPEKYRVFLKYPPKKK